MFTVERSSLPITPGVYLFKDQENTFLYIGKAKNLKKRILSYFTDRQVDWKLELLLKKAVALETITTESEKEALLLEADLISTHKPLFNRLLTSSTPFTYIICDAVTVELPQMKMTRTLSPREGELVVGPFLTKKEAWIVYKNSMEFFNLDSCGKNIPGGCLQFHIGKCAGSCRLNFDKAAYRERFVLARTLFSDEALFERIIEKEIEKTIKQFEFDRVEELTAYKNDYKKYFISLFEKGGEVQDRIENVLLDLSLKEEIINKALFRIKEIFQLNTLPKTVDCIDISHFQGHSAVGSCVRFANGLFSKKESKTYKMPLDINNDYANLSFLVTTHYRELGFCLPDVLVIDGGKGQLGTIKKLKLKTEIVALAKREETLYFIDDREPIKLSLHDPLGIFLISLRNTAHNVAIGFHGRLFTKRK